MASARAFLAGLPRAAVGRNRGGEAERPARLATRELSDFQD
jgi:hypothetical protein